MTDTTRRSRPGPGRALLGTLLCLIAGVTVALAACGVPIDSEARTIRTTTTTEVTTTTAAEGSGHMVTLHFIADDDGDAILTPRKFETEAEPTPSAALELLLSVSAPDGLTSAIPPNTELLGLEIEGDRATVDLSAEMDGIPLDLERSAYAQIALAVLDSSDVAEVGFSIEGTQVDPPTEDGNKKVITEADLHDRIASSGN